MNTEYSMNWEEVRNEFRKWREDTARCSEEVVDKYEYILCDYIHKLGDERWVVYEQVFMSALDCNREDIATECLQALNEQFPGSLRVRRLSAMQLECEEKYEDAVKIYDHIIKMDETNSVVRKRKIAILKAQGKVVEAIKEMNEYLKTFMSDQEAWGELCDLYLLEQDYAKAAYCFEELIIFNPHNHLYHQRYAEIKYTQGGMENLEVARAYFSQALKLNPNNMRAAYGLLLTASNLAAMPKNQLAKKKENAKYAAWASNHIAEKYKTGGVSKDSVSVKSLQDMVQSLNLGGSGD